MMKTETKRQISDPLTEKVIACAYRVHSQLGAGFTERVYHNALIVEFEKNNINYERETEFKIIYEGEKVGKLRVDLIVEGKVIVELKAVTGILPKLFEAQLVSYLKASDFRRGLLINFGNRSCQVRRLVNKAIANE